MTEENASTTTSPSAADTRDGGKQKKNNTLTGSRETGNNDRGIRIEGEKRLSMTGSVQHSKAG